ncbi:MAG: hypothetical protein ACI3YC_01415, partial [Alloprevotella sp.]
DSQGVGGRLPRRGSLIPKPWHAKYQGLVLEYHGLVLEYQAVVFHSFDSFFALKAEKTAKVFALPLSSSHTLQ